jgi:hypothetical protein
MAELKVWHVLATLIVVQPAVVDVVDLCLNRGVVEGVLLAGD